MSTVESIARPRRNGERRRAPTASISKESPAITGVVEDRKSGSAGMPRPTLFPYTTLFRSSSVNSRERSGINTILHELNPLFTINVTMRDIKSKNVYSRVNSKATTQWRKTESANGVHLEGVASDNRSS